MFFRIFQHLLPNAKAWRLIVDKQLRQFFEGLSDFPSDIKDFFDLVWRDIDPQETRELSLWESQFGLQDTGLTEQERRDRLDGAWAAQGGQSPRYIQDTLQAAGFDVYVHEWWSSAGPPAVPRDPRDVLNDGRGEFSLGMVDGGVDSQDGDADSQDGKLGAPRGFALVNKVYERQTVGDGLAEMNDGAVSAQDGGIINIFTLKRFVIPDDPTTWPYFLYIGGQNYPDHANVLTSRQNEFETLCLKICPTQQWLGMLITYT